MISRKKTSTRSATRSRRVELLSGMRVTSPVNTSFRTSSKGSHQKQLDLYSRCRNAVACTSGVNLWRAMCLRSESKSDKNRSGTQTGQTTKNTTATLVSSLYAAVPHLRLKSARENSTAAFGPSWKEMHDHEMKISEQTLGKKQKSRPSERGSADSTAEYNREPRGVFDAVTTFSEAIIDLPEAVRSGRLVESSEFILATRFRRPLERDGAMFLGLLGTAICPDPVEEEVRCISAAGAATPRLLEHDDLR